MVTDFKFFGFGVALWTGSVSMKDTKSCVSYCGWLSDSFIVDSGIRQGCPFSPLAFVLAVEMLTTKIRDFKDITGIKYWSTVNNVNLEAAVKIALYVDDITLFLQNEQEIFHALSIIEFFFLRISVLRINDTKSEAMWLGSKQKLCRSI